MSHETVRIVAVWRCRTCGERTGGREVPLHEEERFAFAPPRCENCYDPPRAMYTPQTLEMFWQGEIERSGVEKSVVLSEDYLAGEARVDFYTNSSIRIARGEEQSDGGVWLDNLEKRALLEALRQEVEDD